MTKKTAKKKDPAETDSASQRAKFLANARNIRYAYQIWEAFPQAAVDAHWQFWFDLKDVLSKKLSKRAGWELEFAHSSEEDVDRARDTGASAYGVYIGLVPKKGTSGIYCYPCIEQQSDDMEPICLRLGMCLSDVRPKTWKPAIKKLIEEELGEEGYKCRPDWWYLAYRDVDYRKYPRANIVERLANGSLVAELSGSFLDFVDKNLKLVQQINSAIKK